VAVDSFEAIVSRYWWLLVLRGAVAIVFGIAAFVWPGLTLAALLILFALYATADGIAAIVVGIKDYGERDRWWATLLGGVVSLAAGVLTFLNPGLTAFALLMLIAFWACTRGVLDIAAAIRLRRVIEGEWLLALSGTLSIGFGLLLLAFPGAGAVAVAWWIGAYAMLAGALLVLLGFRVRTLTRTLAA
jgi:uncharacterized membrane protein HdeD (DUF308 family)